MHGVGLKTPKNRLGEYVRPTAADETVVITDRGRSVAEIVPRKPLEGLTPFQERGVREALADADEKALRAAPAAPAIPGYALQ
jgi:prevent-host-death family protein